MKLLTFMIYYSITLSIAFAGPYYEVVNDTTSGTSSMTISGYIGVAASTNTSTIYKFRIDGPGGYIQFPDGTIQTTAGGGTVEISTAIIDGLPIGSIIAYSTTTPPSGYLYCDGTTYSTTTYSELFAVIGYQYGGSGATFAVPDMRGMFMRGAFGNLNGSDPDANRVVGSTQTDAFQGHTHNIAYPLWHRAAGVPYGTQGNWFSDVGNPILEPATLSPYGNVRVSSETRPKNIAVAFMIKYANTLTVQVSTTILNGLVNSSNTFTGANTFSSLLDVSGSLKVGGGSVITKIEHGYIGTGSAGSAGSSGSVTFSSSFSSVPRIFLQVDESVDDNGATSVRVTAKSTTGFSWKSYTGSIQSASDGIFWMAVGQ